MPELPGENIVAVSVGGDGGRRLVLACRVLYILACGHIDVDRDRFLPRAFRDAHGHFHV